MPHKLMIMLEQVDVFGEMKKNKKGIYTLRIDKTKLIKFTECLYYSAQGDIANYLTIKDIPDIYVEGITNALLISPCKDNPCFHELNTGVTKYYVHTNELKEYFNIK